MDFQEFKKILEQNADAKAAAFATGYLRNQFKHYGVPASKKTGLLKPLWDKKTDPIDWGFVDKCWAGEEREWQYVAIEYLWRHVSQLSRTDIPHLRRLAEDKAWWDTIDSLNGLFGDIATRDESVKDIMRKWSVDKNFWIRRISIIFQLSYKGKTDTALLSETIKNNFGDKEFFINKAIGWALREYSKTNSEWVREFIKVNLDDMAKLSIREASKYI